MWWCLCFSLVRAAYTRAGKAAFLAGREHNRQKTYRRVLLRVDEQSGNRNPGDMFEADAQNCLISISFAYLRERVFSDRDAWCLLGGCREWSARGGRRGGVGGSPVATLPCVALQRPRCRKIANAIRPCHSDAHPQIARCRLVNLDHVPVGQCAGPLIGDGDRTNPPVLDGSLGPCSPKSSKTGMLVDDGLSSC